MESAASSKMKKTRAIHLIQALLFYFSIVVLSGAVMIAASEAVRGVEIFWLIKQSMPPAIIASFLALGTVIFDKLDTPYLRLVERGGPSERVFMPALTGAALFAVTVLVEIAAEGGFSSNSAYETLPLSRFLPYFMLTILFTGFVQPVIEEHIFRARILPIAAGVMPAPAAAVTVSFFFALLHYANFASSFIFSLVMCRFAFRFGLRACISAHIAYNLIAILVR